ncbi:hypothetical protein [Bradyrhizobium sp. UFLA03-84]|uniref:hypothetical protein n=1 Tax=Bradyrhizobium sp. UFLA03-84 TaxID=418599 RepID=UPI0013043555
MKDLFASETQRVLEPFPLSLPSRVFGLDPLLDGLPLAFELPGSVVVLALRIVQRALRFGDQLLSPGPFLLARRLFLSTLRVPALLLASRRPRRPCATPQQ